MQSSAPPATTQAFHDRLIALRGTLPRRLQDCADYLSAHHEQIALSTVAQIGQRAGVPPSAVMRFCHILGFSGYAEMQKLFRDALTGSPPDYATRLHNLKAGGADHPAALLAEFVEAGRLSLEGLTRNVNEVVLFQCVEILSQANTVHLAGFRRSFPVASYLSYVFDKLGVPSLLHDGVAGLRQRSTLRSGDALLAVTFAPYSDETLDLARQARNSGLPVIFLTDPPSTRLLGLADAILTVKEVDFGAFRSLSATIAMALALAVAVAARRDS
jgi:DNA-binding MurR/RpiR family transcriptional regulator